MLADSLQRSPQTNGDAAPYRARFRCFRGCEGEYSVYEVLYTCPKCGGLLEVHHDLEPLRAKSADEWRTLIDSRVGTTRWPYGSGVGGDARVGDAGLARRECSQHV
jgi:threonine synthase